MTKVGSVIFFKEPVINQQQKINVKNSVVQSNPKRICDIEVSSFRKVCSFMHSILDRGCYCNHYINPEWHSGNQPVALLSCYGSLGLVSLIFLLRVPNKFSMGYRSGEMAGQSSTVMVSKPVTSNKMAQKWAGKIEVLNRL